MNSENGLPLGKRITLHRNPTIENQVQENLKTLKLHMANKKNAQRRYYDKPGRSPLLTKPMNKTSVHERLGHQRRKPMAYDFTTDNAIIRNKHFQRRTNNNGIIKYKNRNPLTKNLGQMRLQKYRQHLAENLPVFSRIRLKRNAAPSQPFNCTVEVKNNHGVHNEIVEFSNRHSVMGSLNLNLQEEIRMLQSQNVVEPNFIPNEAIHTVGYGVTKILLNNRFSLLG